MATYFSKIAICTVWLVCLLHSSTHAQLKLNGQLLYQKDKNVAAFVPLLLIPLQEDLDTLSTESNENGHFTFEATIGNYLLQVQEHQQLLYVTSDTSIGEIYLSHTRFSELAGVEIIANKSSLHMEDGRLIYTPPMQSAQSAFDIVQTTPSLIVNDESIEILGKGAPRIMINGKWERMNFQQLVNYLKSIPATQVKRIEIVKNPGAEYDAENRSGYINIVLNGRRERGIDGTIATTVSKASSFQVDPTANINANFGKLHFNVNTGFNMGKTKTRGSNILHYPDKYWQEDNLQEKQYQSESVGGSAGYQINDRHSIEAGINLQISDWTSKEHNATQINNAARTKIDSSLLTEGRNPESVHSYSVNVNYTYDINSIGKRLKFDFDHFNQDFTRNQDFNNRQFDANGMELTDAQRFLSGNDQQIVITTANLHMDQPLQWIQLSYGAKYTYVSNRNKTSFYQHVPDDWIPDLSRFDHFVYDETTYALFVKAERSFQKWNINAGLRFEHTQTEGVSEVYKVNNRNSYSKLFPSADLTFTPNTNNIYSLTYSRRIDRPYFGQVNPFRWYHTQYAFTHGNPSLQPYFSHNVALDYILKQKYSLNTYYSRSDNVFSEYDFADPVTNKRETRVDNILNLNIYGLSASAQINLWKRWLLFPQAGLSYTQIFSKVDFLDYSAGTFVYTSLYQQITLGKRKQWLIDLNTYYYAPRRYGIMQFKTLWAQSVKLTYSTTNRQWQFVFAANDIFRTTAMRYNSMVNETLRERYVYRDQQSIGITVRYKFERGKTKTQQQKEAGNQDEMNRLGG